MYDRKLQIAGTLRASKNEICKKFAKTKLKSQFFQKMKEYVTNVKERNNY